MPAFAARPLALSLELVDSGRMSSPFRFIDLFAGVGGFVNIAQSARRLVFCCTFQAKGNAKFVRPLQHVCSHGPSAYQNGQQVIYVTERAVFELTPNGLRLIEIAAGLDLQRDVLDLMQFAPQLAESIRTIP